MKNLKYSAPFLMALASCSSAPETVEIASVKKLNTKLPAKRLQATSQEAKPSSKEDRVLAENMLKEEILPRRSNWKRDYLRYKAVEADRAKRWSKFNKILESYLELSQKNARLKYPNYLVRENISEIKRLTVKSLGLINKLLEEIDSLLAKPLNLGEQRKLERLKRDHLLIKKRLKQDIKNPARHY